MSPATGLREALAAAELPRSGRFLLGVSGGRDSMALLHALSGFGQKRFTVCHLNHRLRGAAASADARFVEREARRLGLAYEGGTADTRALAKQQGLSLEHAAREARRAFFLTCARTHRCRTLLLAHHADDQAETCLLNLFRGTGMTGLSGMQKDARRDGLRVIRPLLTVSRETIAKYVEEHEIRFREDASNASLDFTRNRLRHEVLPLVEQVFGYSPRPALLRLAEILRAENEWMESLIPTPTSELSCQELRAMSLGLQRRFVLRWLRQEGIFEPGFAETEKVLSLLPLPDAPAKVNLPRGVHARRRAGRIFLEFPRPGKR